GAALGAHPRLRPSPTRRSSDLSAPTTCGRPSPVAAPALIEASGAAGGATCARPEATAVRSHAGGSGSRGCGDGKPEGPPVVLRWKVPEGPPYKSGHPTGAESHDLRNNLRHFLRFAPRRRRPAGRTHRL